MAGYRTNNLYFAAAIIWETGIYPDNYSSPDSRGIISVEWNDEESIRESVARIENRTMRVCPRGLSVIHINLKRKINAIKGANQNE